MSVLIPVIDYIDGAARRIYLKTGVDAFHWLDDVYVEYRNWRKTEANRVWEPLLKASGNEPKDPARGKYTPRFVTMLLGTRVVPFDENILCIVEGEAITDNPEVDPDPFDTTTRTQPLKLYITPPAAEIVRDTVSLAAIARMEFGERVTVDKINGVDGVGGNIGTPGNPSNNIPDTITIASDNGFSDIAIKGNITLTDGDILSGLDIYGKNQLKTSIVIEDLAVVDSVVINDARLSGVLDGDIIVINCVVGGLTYVNGYIHNCAITGPVVVVPGSTLSMLGCYSLTKNAMVPIDASGSGQTIHLSQVAGDWLIQNFSGTSVLEVDLDPGLIVLDTATVTGGTIIVRGEGMLMNTEGEMLFTGVWNGITITNHTSCPHSVAKEVWDRVLTGSTHNVRQSAGRRLRQLAGSIVYDGVAAGSGVGDNQIELDVDASDVDGAYDPTAIAIVEGTGAGQSRLILDYSGATKMATVDRDWKTLPDETSEFIISTNPGRENVNEGLLRDATINTLQLNTSASALDGVYIGQIIFLRSGAGQDQACKVLSYDGATKTATLCKDLADIPDTTTGYVILPTGFFDGMELAGVVANSVWTYTRP